MKVKVINKSGKERNFWDVSSVNDCNPNSCDSAIVIISESQGIATIWKHKVLGVEIFV